MKKVLYKNANIITMADPSVRAVYGDLLVNDDSIDDVIAGGTAEVPAGADVIDMKGRYIMPGMINCHLHVMCNPDSPAPGTETYEESLMVAGANCRDLLDHGYTAVRSMGDFKNLEMTLRSAINSGKLHGPRIKVCGKALTSTGGHFGKLMLICDTMEQTVQNLNDQIAHDPDFIKVMVTGGVSTAGDPNAVHFPQENLEYVVKASHEAGLKVAAHCMGRAGTLAAAKAGVDTIEHGTMMDAECAEVMLQKGITFVPTLMPGYSNMHSPKLNLLPEAIRIKMVESVALTQDAARTAHEYGIPIAMGTDGGATNTPISSGAMELKLLEDCGYSREECLRAATVDAARVMDMSDLCGSLEIGKKADFIVLETDPLDDLKVLQHVSEVYMDGVRCK